LRLWIHPKRISKTKLKKESKSQVFFKFCLNVLLSILMSLTQEYKKISQVWQNKILVLWEKTQKTLQAEMVEIPKMRKWFKWNTEERRASRDQTQLNNLKLKTTGITDHVAIFLKMKVKIMNKSRILRSKSMLTRTNKWT